jgi:hypothetical protein
LQLLEGLEPREAEVIIGIFKKDLGVFGIMKIHEGNFKNTPMVYFPKVLTDILSFILNIRFTYPNHIPRDIFKGAAYLAKGAEEGRRQAAYTLGCLYEKGEYIPQDHKKACYYLVLATLQKHDQAHRVLIMFQHANKGNYDKEFDAAEAQYGKIQNMRTLYKCL